MNRICKPIFLLFFLCALYACPKHDIPYTQRGDWAAEAQLDGPARSEAVSFVINNVAYLGTGWDGLNTRYADFWKYDPANNIWSQVISMPDSTVRSSAAAFAIDGKGYVGTGYDGFKYLNDFYQFDPALNLWVKIADFKGGSRHEAVAFAIGDFGYVGTGFDGANALKDFYKFDPIKNDWIVVGFSGNKRYGAVAFVYNNTGYVVTGVNDGIMQTDFWKFDPASDSSQWTELRHINNFSSDSYDDGYTSIVRSNAAVFVEGNQAFISTGENGPYNSNTWEYDIPNDVWTEKTPFEGPATTGAVGFSLIAASGSGGFIATGRNSPGQAGSSDYLWQFFPGNLKNVNDN